MSEEDATKLSMAVHNHYWYQFYVDDLPMWGMVGDERKEDQKRIEIPEEQLDAVNSESAPSPFQTNILPSDQ